MGLKIQIIAFVIGVVFFVFILRSIKKNSFAPTISVLWILVAIFLLSIPIFQQFYQWITYNVIGIVDARHIIYIVLIGFLLIYNYYLSSKITLMNDQIKHLISFTAILENKIKGKNENQ